jgi:pimeloyl-ACP methyl ester carboxylesterase
MQNSPNSTCLTPSAPAVVKSGRNQLLAKTEEQTIQAGAITLNYAEVSGPGKPLVLLHGGSARWQSFEVLLPDLAASWHIYAPDFRGHGKSAWVSGSYRLQDYANDTIAFLRQRVKEPAYLFGHSLGGMVALLVAAQYPDGVLRRWRCASIESILARRSPSRSRSFGGMARFSGRSETAR